MPFTEKKPLNLECKPGKGLTSTINSAATHGTVGCCLEESPGVSLAWAENLVAIMSHFYSVFWVIHSYGDLRACAD